MPSKNSGFAALRRSAIVIVATAAVLVSASGALAWSLPPSLSDNTGAINFWNNCGISGSNSIWAADGDVVTTTKWNQFVCRFRQTLNVLYDWGRNKTPFLSVQSNTITSQSGSYVNAIRLADTGGGGAVNFYDSNSAFALGAPQNMLGSIRYTNGAGGGLHLSSNNGPVYIDTANNTAANSHADDALNGTRQFPIGWVAEDLMTTTQFDIWCSYRVKTDHGWVINMTVSGGVALMAILDSNYVEDGVGDLVRVMVENTNKTAWVAQSMKDMAVPTTGHYGFMVKTIEKLCLPRYKSANLNSGDYPASTSNTSPNMN